MRRAMSALFALPLLACANAAPSETDAPPSKAEPSPARLQAVLEQQPEVCTELSQRLCADLGPDTKTCALVRQQTPSFAVDECAMMLADYDQVLAELTALEAKNRPLPAAAAAKLAGGAQVPSFGPLDAAITVVTFADFQCPYCAVAAAVNEQLRARYGDRVRFVARQFPLSFHPDAHLAAQAALAAHAQGQFWAYHDLLFANHEVLGRASLDAFAEQLGLDMQAFESALDQGTYAATVDADYALGEEVYVTGTPTVFINGSPFMDATNAEAFAAELERLLAE